MRRPLLVTVVLALVASVATISPAAAEATVDRVAGPDRYATAAAVSARTFERADVVYLASGESYADALAAAPVAATTQSPVLLTARASLPASTRAELQRLAPDLVYVVGGTGAVSDAVVGSLRGLAAHVERIAGPDRYSTATLLTRDVEPGGPVFVASGQAFPDALSGGALAGRQGAPLLLVLEDGVPAVVADELHRLEPSEIIVLGGPGSVSDAVVASLRPHTTGTVRRVSGADRYATSAAVSAQVIEQATTVILATGAGFADALAGGAAAAFLDAPVLLVTAPCLPVPVAAELARVDPDEVLVLGGTGAVGRTVENLSMCLPGGTLSVVDDGSATLDELDLVWRGLVDARDEWGDSGPIELRVTDTTNAFNPSTPGAAFLHGLDIYTDPFRAFASNGEWGQYNVVVHEYFHTLQHWLARRGAAQINGTVVPVWLFEGSASYLASRLQTDTYTESGTFESVLANHVQASKQTDATLCSLFTHADVYGRPDTEARLSLATIAIDLLIERHGADATIDRFWRALATDDLRTAFESAYGESIDDFCGVFEERRATL